MGKKAYWLEVTIASPEPYGKSLREIAGDTCGVSSAEGDRAIPGHGGDGDAGIRGTISEIKDDPNNKVTATEKRELATAAGSFECQHITYADGSEVWVSDKVGPMKVVKSVGAAKDTRVLVKTYEPGEGCDQGTGEGLRSGGD